MFLEDGLTGSECGACALYTASPVRAIENEFGVQAPVGFCDPAGFTADGNSVNFARRRQTELKQCRVSMHANSGYITPAIAGMLPGYLSPSAGLKFGDTPNGLAVISNMPAAGCGQVLAYGAFCELSPDQSAGTKAAAGDFGFKDLTPCDPAEKTKKFSAELANKRLAMTTIVSMFIQKGLTVWVCGDCALYTASPLRAFENEISVQAPVGVWDPAGFTGDGNFENVARRRLTELQRGLVSMLATMLYNTRDITGKLPGCLSPSAGFKIADIPNGLTAISKVAAGGWGQILAMGCEDQKVVGRAHRRKFSSPALHVVTGPCTLHLRCAGSRTSLAFRHQLAFVTLLASCLMETSRGRCGWQLGPDGQVMNGLSESLEGPAYRDVGAGGSSGRLAMRTK